MACLLYLRKIENLKKGVKKGFNDELEYDSDFIVSRNITDTIFIRIRRQTNSRYERPLKNV